MRPLLVSSILAVAACGGDAPTPDAEIVDDAPSVSVDAGRVCAAAGDCACFSNYDCPAGTTCTSLDTSGTNVWCLPGARGTGALGAPCTGEADCASALCVDDVDDGLTCSDRCEDEQDCVAKLPVCLLIGFGIDEQICAPSGN